MVSHLRGYRARLVDAVDRVLELLDADPGYASCSTGSRWCWRITSPYGRRDARRWRRACARPPVDRPLVRAARHAAAVAAKRWCAICCTAARSQTRSARSRRRLRPRFVRPPGAVPAALRRLRARSLRLLARQRQRDRPARSALLVDRPRRQRASPLPCCATAISTRPACRRTRRRRLRRLARRSALAAPIATAWSLLMNGFDHMLPDAHTGASPAALAEHTGATVERGLLDDARRAVGGDRLHEFRGDLRRRAASPTCCPAYGRHACRSSCAIGAAKRC